MKVEGFTPDSATLCFNGKRSRYQKVNSVLQNAPDLAYAHLQLKIFAGVKYVPRPLKWRKNRERRGIGQGNGRERKIEGLGRKEVTGREGIDGRSGPF